MKTFKEYLVKKNDKKEILSWPSSNAEIRKEKTKEPSILSWSSLHAELRKDKVNEEVTARTNIDVWAHNSDSSEKNDKRNKRGATYDASIHDHEEVRPKRIIHSESIRNYTESPSSSVNGHGSSKNINGYLRNRMGEKTTKVASHPPEAVKKSVENLSSNFTPANTNRKAITTYSGVPAHIGEKLEASKKGDIHHLAGFTSTSTSKVVADEFATTHNKENSDVRHIVKFHVHPGAGLSVAARSGFNEDEVLLHHGAKTEYSHTEINTGLNHNRGASARKIETHIHHVYVHPEHIPLSEYGSYDHPKP